jgi:hypothetical protein
MPNAKNEITDKAKPEGNLDPSVANTPDVKVENWSAEEIAEESTYKDGTEVKEEMEEGKRVKRENKAGHILDPPSFNRREGS